VGIQTKNSARFDQSIVLYLYNYTTVIMVSPPVIVIVSRVRLPVTNAPRKLFAAPIGVVWLSGVTPIGQGWTNAMGLWGLGP